MASPKSDKIRTRGIGRAANVVRASFVARWLLVGVGFIGRPALSFAGHCAFALIARSASVLLLNRCRVWPFGRPRVGVRVPGLSSASYVLIIYEELERPRRAWFGRNWALLASSAKPALLAAFSVPSCAVRTFQRRRRARKTSAVWRCHFRARCISEHKGNSA